MASLKIESISNNKFAAITSLFSLLLLCFYFVPGFIISDSLERQYVNGAVCKHKSSTMDTYNEPFDNIKDKRCLRSGQYFYKNDKTQLTYIFKLAGWANDIGVEYSTWQPSTVAHLKFVQYNSILENEPITSGGRIQLSLYRTEDGEFRRYFNEETKLDLHQTYRKYGNALAIVGNKILFHVDLGFADEYLLNVHVPNDMIAMNMPIPELTLNVVSANPEFVEFNIYLKTIFFPIVTVFVIWFWRALKRHPLPSNLPNYTLLALGITLALLDLPLEYLTQLCDMRFMLIGRDLRADVFYAVFMLFLINFTSSHVIEDENSKRKPHLSRLSRTLLAFWCLGLGVLQLVARSIVIAFPPYMSWDRDGMHSFVVTYGILLYLAMGSAFFLIAIVCNFCKVSLSIQNRNQISNTSMFSTTQLTDDICQRYKIMLRFILFCIVMTIWDTLEGEYVKSQMKSTWDVWSQPPKMHIGTFAFWNLLTITLMYLYSPSAQQTNQADDKFVILGGKDDDDDVVFILKDDQTTYYNNIVLHSEMENRERQPQEN